ncbi:hypothetical protein [Paenibacillus cookii]|uniref:Uncharacterized protein n=1 Tax=Paenibacillus cookii TaxID=157839 RepID=A0ABQ4LRP1_9BACL|nr:hypothetical protein [Paenibacillus cookii]GIO65920.1 hypothetical protein J21TS3_07410 [Paenibacillus cookii]
MAVDDPTAFSTKLTERRDPSEVAVFGTPRPLAQPEKTAVIAREGY